MHDPNRMMKWLLVIGLVVLSLVILYPPSQKLKGGIDLVGGTSLMFEIDTTGLEKAGQRGLSSRVMDILKNRVDPKGQLNLEWRPAGNTRLEIRMPRPPKAALERRAAYNAAVDRLKARNLSRFEVESALNAPPADRPNVLAGLVRNAPERTPLFETLVAAFDEYQAAQGSDDLAVAEAAGAAYEEAMAAVLATSMPINRLTDVLALPQGDKRREEIDKLRDEFRSCDAGEMGQENGKLLTKAVYAYDAWAQDKADLEDPSDLKRLIRGAGVLEFRILAERDAASPTHTIGPNAQEISKYTEQLAKYGARPRAGDVFEWFPIENVVRFLHADDLASVDEIKDLPGRPVVEEYAGRYYVLAHSGSQYGLLRSSGKGEGKWKLRYARPDRDPLTGENAVIFQLDPRGGQMFGNLTGPNVGRQLCIFLDGTAMSHANIRTRITDRCQISGGFTFERMQELVKTLEAGSLPARLKETPLSEKTVGPSLGETNRRHGVQAAVLGGIAVAVFVLLYYGLAAGGMADVALALNLLFVLSAMALMQATFTLPGIAALILTVGMAIDANVLIFERIREERDRGIVFKKALNTGYDKAFSTIMDANLTTLITCVILGFVGSEEVKGFAIVLGIGIVTSMFTALFVTRLVFNTGIAQGVLKDFSMRRIISRPSIDWLSLRKTFWPVSLIAVVLGMGIFVTMSSVDPEAVYDIEFLGGTSVQIDFKPGVEMTDEQAHDIVASNHEDSAGAWLRQAADRLEEAEASIGETPGEFTLTAAGLTGEQTGVLMRATIEDLVERNGIYATGGVATFVGKSGELTLEKFKDKIVVAAEAAREAANRLRGARVQSVGEAEPDTEVGPSYEVVTVETNTALVQAALLAVLGDRLVVQRALNFATVVDDNLTREPFFVVEEADHYLSDVIGGDANFDIRRFRGGVAIEVVLDEREEPVTVAELETRLREIGLQPEFEQYRTRDSSVFPAGEVVTRKGGEDFYKHFAVLAVDETLLYEDDAAQWTDGLATKQLEQVEAALGSEKSLSKVVKFAPQIAGQTKNRAIFAVVLALGAIVSYLWLRFGTKEYGLAAIVALVHDVGITLGLVTVGHFVYASFIGKALAITDFKIDLPMIAAILTVIGYSLNDTIVVFDRIRENRGRMGSLTPALINDSLNQTLSRTLLTSITTFLVVIILYIFGGKGVHGFSFALLIGVVVGTYSSLGIATPLLYRPVLLRAVVAVIAASVLIGIVVVETDDMTARLVLTAIVAVGAIAYLIRNAATNKYANPRSAGRG